MKLVGYIRVSSESQAENTSLGEQRAKLQAYCLAMGHELIQIFEDVQSGKDSDRLGFQNALNALDNVDGLIACKLDRVARNTRDVLALVEDVLQPKNKALILLDLQVDTSTPTGKMILTMMAAVATLERDTINERTQGGRRAKANQGGYAYGAPKFGQVAVDGQLIPDENEQTIIETIRKHRKSGKSYAKIAQYLNENELKSKQGKDWTAKVVMDVLKRLKTA
jgi:DNA invertase Pin-like site-specific DNA recombinase